MEHKGPDKRTQQHLNDIYCNFVTISTLHMSGVPVASANILQHIKRLLKQQATSCYLKDTNFNASRNSVRNEKAKDVAAISGNALNFSFLDAVSTLLNKLRYTHQSSLCLSLTNGI